MRSLKDIPIKRKIVLLITATTGLALIVACAAFTVYEFVTFRKVLRDDLLTLAEVIEPNCTAALDFDLPNEGTENLAALRLEPHIVAACIYRQDNNIFAAYAIRGTSPSFPLDPGPDGFRVGDDHLVVARPMILDGKRIGTLYLRSNFRGLRSRLAAYLATALVVLVTGCFIAFAIAARFQRIISAPVLNLARTAKEISNKKDYSLRAEKFGQDELGEFTDVFNHMITQIHKQDVELRQQQDDLERKVSERTEELSNSNELLKSEIAERRQAETALAAEKQRLAVTLRSIGDGVITTDTDGRIVLMNHAAETLTRWEQKDALNRPLADVLRLKNDSGATLDDIFLNTVLGGGRAIDLDRDETLRTRDDNERRIASSGAPIRDADGRIVGMVVTFRDITDRQMLDQERFKSSKLESVGILAGGIAHDFNNMLTAILGNISLVKRRFETDDNEFTRLAAAETATQRARALTEQLLTFAKGGAPMLNTMSIQELITESADFILSGSNVRVDYAIPTDLWPVRIDSGQMSQVVNNLVINAQQAMPAGGIITIEAENIARTRTDVFRGLPLDPSNYVRVSISDDGIGISEADQAMIFDPYFTTKPQGSGLGLATTFSILKNHRGHVTVVSERGKGTTFRFFLPAMPGAVLKPKTEIGVVVEGQGRILVMDDDEFIRDVSAEMLTDLGYSADMASDGKTAIQLYQDALAAETPYLAVILDLIIPGGMGGKDVIKQLLAIDPNVKSIVSSGYSHDPVTANFQSYGFSRVLPKPFDIQELSDVLNEILTDHRVS